MDAPSGRQHLLVGPVGQQATIVEVGGGLRTYAVGRTPVLDGYAEDGMCASGRGQPLLPWPNRTGDGRYYFDGIEHQLPLTEVGAGNAIHGLVRWASWEAARASTASVTMTHRVHPQPGWPWPLDLTLHYTLTASGLEVTVGATNVGPSRCPWGAGFHPYLSAFGSTVDDLDLQAPGATRYLADARGLPTGTAPVEGSDVDFRAGRRIGAAQLDVAFTDLERDSSGRATVELTTPDGLDRMSLWMDERWTHLMIFTGDTLGDVSRRRRGLAVEPMTAAPDMLRSGDGLVVLDPGQEWSGTWGISPGALAG
jgi:aldose 1-epimerase